MGHKWSADIISKHLVLPLISLNYLTCSSADAQSDAPDADVERVCSFDTISIGYLDDLICDTQAVDKLGRTARRTLDTHIKNAMSKPRVSTAIRRMTAMFNFVPDLRMSFYRKSLVLFF